MTNGFISFIFAVGASTWLYTKLQRSSGNNTKQSLIASSIVAVILFGVMFLTLSSFLGGS